MSTIAELPAIRPGDFLNVDHLLSEEELMIRDSVRRYVAEQVLPNVGDWFEEGRLPRELARDLGELGLLGMHLDGYGCAARARRPTG
jgi:glutaryl-CoA dehydrogenase